MQHYMTGPVEEVFGNSIRADIPEPGSNNNFWWGVIATLVTGSIVYLIITLNKSTAENTK